MSRRNPSLSFLIKSPNFELAVSTSYWLRKASRRVWYRSRVADIGREPGRETSTPATPFHHLSKPRHATYYCLFQHTRTVSRALPRRFLRPKAVISQQSPCAATYSGDAGRSFSVSWNVVTYPTQQQDQRESWPAGDADASSFFGSLSALLVRISSMTPRSSASATLRYLSRSIISLTSSILYLS